MKLRENIASRLKKGEIRVQYCTLWAPFGNTGVLVFAIASKCGNDYQNGKWLPFFFKWKQKIWQDSKVYNHAESNKIDLVEESNQRLQKEKEVRKNKTNC